MNIVKLKLVLLGILLVIALTIAITPCNATRVAISGEFYRYTYVLAQGESIKGENMYVIVFNMMDKPVFVNVTYEAPECIKVNLSSTGYLLNPKEYRKVYIELKADEDAVPGTYAVKIIATVYETKGNLPVKVITSAAQEAKVIVTGEQAFVEVVAIDPAGNIAEVALIKLFKENYEIASAYGKLKKKVTPGNYTAVAYLLNEEVARKSFTLKPDEYKRVELLIKAVYFEVFDVLPAVDEEGRMGYAHIIVVVKNVYRELPNTSIVLYVTGNTNETIEIYKTTKLLLGRTEARYNYIPKEGWKDGKYIFQAKVISEGIVYAISPKKELEVSVMKPIEKMISGAVIAIIISVLLAILLMIVLLARRKRRKILEEIYINLKQSLEIIQECVGDVKEINERVRKLM